MKRLLALLAFVALAGCATTGSDPAGTPAVPIPPRMHTITRSPDFTQ